MSSRFTQDRRHMAVSTPLGKDALLLETLEGTEAVSELFEFRLGLLAPATKSIAFEKIVGRPSTIQLSPTNAPNRLINGIITEFSQAGEVPGAMGDVTFVRYEAILVPMLWRLTRRSQSRIFQHVTIPDILRTVFIGLQVKYNLQGKYEQRDYCVQYRETDFDFASRLMEEEGIYYYFTHTASSHTMIVSDHPMGHLPIADPIRYEQIVGGVHSDELVQTWTKTQRLRSGRTTLWDHCFELPGQNLEAGAPTRKTIRVGQEHHRLTLAGNDTLERYDYPGGFAQRFDGIDAGGGDRPKDLEKIFRDNARTAEIRMGQEDAQTLQIVGDSTVRAFTPGYRFTLEDHFNANGKYILTRVRHFGTLVGAYTDESETPVGYQNKFECIPAELPFRPQMRTPKPVIAGTQTAVVTGFQGEEIFTDKYGRVKVQFPWDREGKFDANSSCWLRVSQVHAGKKWGGIDIPRIGEEVIVAFEEGDPDRPIVIGRVYNAYAMPPFGLPGKRSVSGLKSNTYPGGGGDNEISMDDTKGAERMYIHAQYNQDSVIGNNRTTKVGVDDTEEIGNNQTINIGVNQTETIGTNQTTTAGNNIVITAGTSITLKCGASMIHMNQAGFITISGTVITTAAAANLAMTAPLTEVVGGVMVSVVGGVTLVEGGVTHIGGAKLTSVTSGGQIDIVASANLNAKGAIINLNG